MKLYEISIAYRHALEELDLSEGGLGTGLDLEIMGERLRDKAIAIAGFIKELEAYGKSIDEAINSMKERRELIGKKINYLTNYLKTGLEHAHVKSIDDCPYFKIRIKENPYKVLINDESKIPREYMKEKITYSVSKTELKKDLMEGVYIEGAELVQDTRLEIK